MQLHTTAARLLQVSRTLKADPTRTVATGDWTHPSWSAEEYWAWFARCLDRKINRQDGRQNWRRMTDDYQHNQLIDARTIADYGRRIRQTGSTGVLRTAELQRRYPHINNQGATA